MPYIDLLVYVAFHVSGAMKKDRAKYEVVYISSFCSFT